MKEFACPKCGSVDVFTQAKGSAIGLYCGDCGRWIKWITKDELRLVTQFIESNKSSKTILKAVGDGDTVAHCKVKENAELIAKILDADEDGCIFTFDMPDYPGRIAELRETIAKIAGMVEEKEIYTSGKTGEAKADWRRMAEKDHENTYATSLRYEVWREAATLFADLGAAIDKMPK